MQFQIKILTEYRFPIKKNKPLMALIRAIKIFNVVEVRHNHNYLLECEGIKQWFTAYEIRRAADPSKLVNGEYMSLLDYPPYVISKDGKIGKLVPDFIAVPTYLSGHPDNLRYRVYLHPSNGKKFVKQVAELVLNTFTDQVRNRRIIHYKDGDITNLNVENLEYVSRTRTLSNE